jgi:hypothetical protein
MGNHWAFAACCIGLSACPTVDLGPTPEDIAGCIPTKGEPYFESDIWPKYVQNPHHTCVDAQCHVPGGDGGTLHLDPNVPMSFMMNYKLVLPQLNCQRPDESPFLTKPLAGQVGHGGGDIFPSASDPAVVAFLAWFQ